MVRVMSFFLFWPALESLAQVQCPEISAMGCSICGEGKCVTAPDVVFTFPGQPSVPCGTLEAFGSDGTIPLSQCSFLPGLIGDCECAPESVNSSPVAIAPADTSPIAPADNGSPVEMDSPVSPPTNAPVSLAPV
eukprot:CAMPEP_0194171914 /NCGR_PEP_ID=MMETSP0154-20130528/6479_1 /TAXON_ID=1049557 /ORGANISM="Thalassiothrix antarctica, Strain L6-D1" /LENGTH=133 /DNA_ID=CAMNT_0038884433 /DNA_START=15 /DNA_END=412 /DNA_ORIENTATION=+